MFRAGKKQVLTAIQPNSSYFHNYFKTSVYYEFILNEYIESKNYIKISNNTIHLSPLNSTIDIQPNLFGKTEIQILKELNSPSYIFEKKDIKIFIYRWKINGLNNRCKVHFYKNKVFLINHHYTSLKESEKKYVINAFCTKYLGCLNDGTITDSKINDSNNNIIFFNESASGFKISYLSNTKASWFLSMNNEIQLITEKNNNKRRLKDRQFISSI